MDISTVSAKAVPSFPRRLSLPLIAIPVVLLQACSGAITRVEVAPNTPTVCDSTFNTPCGVTTNQPVTVRVWGKGQCDSVGLEFGDGSRVFSPSPFDFGTDANPRPFEATHTYSLAWPGVKTIHAFSARNCMGEARQSIQVMRHTSGSTSSVYRLALGQPFQQVFGQPVGITACAFVPDVRPLRPNTRVSITANPDPAIKINFGCILNGCVYGPDGQQGSSAPSTFPFQGLAKYSLVLRAGTQVVPGSSRVTFTTTQRAPLEVCVNDDVLTDNTGAWGLDISVDETQAE